MLSKRNIDFGNYTLKCESTASNPFELDLVFALYSAEGQYGKTTVTVTGDNELSPLHATLIRLQYLAQFLPEIQSIYPDLDLPNPSSKIAEIQSEMARTQPKMVFPAIKKMNKQEHTEQKHRNVEEPFLSPILMLRLRSASKITPQFQIPRYQYSNRKPASVAKTEPNRHPLSVRKPFWVKDLTKENILPTVKKTFQQYDILLAPIPGVIKLIAEYCAENSSLKP